MGLKQYQLKSIAYATFRQRVMAFAIDILALVVVCYLLKIIIQIVGKVSTKDYFFWNQLDAYELYSWMFLYYPLADKFGGTFGKKIIKIQCVDARSYEQISYIQAYVRIIVVYGLSSFAFFFSGYLITMSSSILFPFYLPMLIDFLILISILFSEKNQGWHDKLAKVIIVKK